MDTSINLSLYIWSLPLAPVTDFYRGGGKAWADIFLPDVQHKNGEIHLLNKD